jgi:hypothetical protein
MHKFYKIKSNARRLIPLFIFLLTLFCSACGKKNQEPEEVIKTETDTYSYEVTCTACEIQFMDKNKSTNKITNKSGKWSYSFEKTNDADLKINIITTNKTYQNINAYILMNDEVIYGDLGYNSFDLSYNVKSGQKSMTYGSYSTGSSGVEAGYGGGSAKPTSSVCGARTKVGGYCKRVVIGGGRCWQHK